jgi:type IX secretion system PorP/SprF family membrane protein
MRIVLLAGFIGLVGSSLCAQDKHFTQFYAAPLYLNPALTGAFEGKYRVGAIYRDQWRKVLDNPIQSFAVGADLRFRSRGKSVYDDAFGLGLQFFHDKVNVVDFSTTQIAVSGAYHKSLGVNNRHYLSLGLQGGLTQRNVNYEPLNFHDEFDGVTGYVLPTGELLPPNNFSYIDLNTGLNYTARFGRYGAFFGGLGLHHISQPIVSFFENEEKGDKLYRKYSAQLSANIPLTENNRVALTPRLLWAAQGPHMEINTGSNIRFALGEYGASALHLGGWARFVRNNTDTGVDAFVAMAGFELNGVLLGLSYDLNTTALSQGQRQTAFEVSVVYLGNYENEEILCPKF